jgi:hypothetical protein
MSRYQYTADGAYPLEGKDWIDELLSQPIAARMRARWIEAHRDAPNFKPCSNCGCQTRAECWRYHHHRPARTPAHAAPKRIA